MRALMNIRKALADEKRVRTLLALRKGSLCCAAGAAARVGRVSGGEPDAAMAGGAVDRGADSHGDEGGLQHGGGGSGAKRVGSGQEGKQASVSGAAGGRRRMPLRAQFTMARGGDRALPVPHLTRYRQRVRK